jgi:hypothetical protein
MSAIPSPSKSPVATDAGLLDVGNCVASPKHAPLLSGAPSPQTTGTPPLEEDPSVVPGSPGPSVVVESNVSSTSVVAAEPTEDEPEVACPVLMASMGSFVPEPDSVEASGPSSVSSEEPLTVVSEAPEHAGTNKEASTSHREKSMSR